MSDVTTVGNLLVNDALPEDMRKAQHVLDKKGAHKLFLELYDKHPEKYVEVLQRLSDVGRDTGWTEGLSVSLSGLLESRKKKELIAQLRPKINAIIDDDTLDSKSRKQLIVQELLKAAPTITDEVVKEAMAERNPFAVQMTSGGRGKKSDINSLRGADLLVMDQNDEFLPVPLWNGFGQGLSPAEYFATTYGQRKGALTVKMGVGQAGYYGKRLGNAAHRLVITKERPDPARLPTGLPTSVEDKDNVGAVLAHPAGDLPVGHVLTARDLDNLKEQGVSDVLIHSPLTELSSDGGISAWAAGKRIRNGLHQVGDNVGLLAAQSISEKLSQATLCLGAGTLVRMGDLTVKPIEAIEPGDWVLGADRHGRTFPTQVVDTHINGVRPCRKYAFADPSERGGLREVVCTSDHKFLSHVYYSSVTGESHSVQTIAVGKLNKRSGIMLSRGAEPIGAAYDWRALLLGVLLGDGCYTEAVHGVHLSCADLSQIAFLNDYLRPHNLQFKLLSGQKIYYRLTVIDGPKFVSDRDAVTGRLLVTRSTNPIKAWLQSLGAYGKYAHEKSIPEDWLAGLDNKAVAELLAGLYVTDGSVLTTADGCSTISFASTSRRLIEQVKMLLEVRFGVYAGRISTSKMRPGRNHPLHKLDITKASAFRRFAEVIPLFGVKKERLRVAAADKEVCKFTAARAPIRNVVDLGELPTYDIEVATEDHLFVLANGLITSNSAKHSGGIKDRVSRSGYDYLNRLIEAPESFPEVAPLAEEDGVVSEVREAPQGGSYVKVGQKDYYIPKGISVTVKVGDALEAGDDLSDGVPHPDDLVRLRGIGEARRLYTKYLKEGLEETGVSTNRRNVETVVAGLLNWADVTDPDGIGDNIYGDTVPFNRLAYSYKPRADAAENDVNRAVGQYLEEPALHYTPGTRITKRVAKDLEKWGIKKAFTHSEAPAFQPRMVRGLQATYNDPDWQVRLAGFYTGRAFSDALHRGATSDRQSTSYVPALANPVDFGKNLQTQGKYGAVVAKLAASFKIKPD